MEQYNPMQSFSLTVNGINAESIQMDTSDTKISKPLLFVKIRSAKIYQFCVSKVPGLIIAVVLNLFFSISFGQAFFPESWVFPESLPRAIGVQMFLFSTMTCQIVMTSLSVFPTAQGSMMVENIPFMHALAKIIIQSNGMGLSSFSTLLIAFGISTSIIGFSFLMLSFFKCGNMMYLFPRQLIVGCIGGIGIFLIITSLEVSTSKPWDWSLEYFQFNRISTFESIPAYILIFITMSLEFFLRVLQHIQNFPVLPPVYFMTIPLIFHLILIPIRKYCPNFNFSFLFFPTSTSANFWQLWELMDVTSVNWHIIPQLLPTFLSMTIFSLMHVPINIPSLSASTHVEADMNRELMAHGISNLLSGLLGGLPNYLCYSSSLLYFKCNGGGKVSGYLLAIITGLFFVSGAEAVSYIPRCMTGCILMHVGVDLTKEAILDSYPTFDIYEYISVIIITIVMTTYDLTTGLAVGAICAAVTFTLQSSRHADPIRGTWFASGLRSSKIRTPEMEKTLGLTMSHVFIVQLQGHLFFANATRLCSELQSLLSHRKNSQKVSHLVLDFTYVLGIDSSAVDRLATLLSLCHKQGVKLCYCRNSRDGFPCQAPLSDRLRHQEQQEEEESALLLRQHQLELQLHRNGSSTSSQRLPLPALSTVTMPGVYVHLADSLDDALAWCEDDVLASSASPVPDSTSSPVTGHETLSPLVSTVIDNVTDKPEYLQRFQSLMCHESEEMQLKLVRYFLEQTENIRCGQILWRQGDPSDRAVLMGNGQLRSFVEGEEALTTETIFPGFLFGEFGLITDTNRRSTVMADTDSIVFVLTRGRYQRMLLEDPYLAVVLSRMCITYLDHRVQHVANRIWGNHAVPI